MNYFFEALTKNYANFSGRARRQEYWMFVLYNFLVAILVGAVGKAIGAGGLMTVAYVAVMFIPGFSVTVRRLHDIGKSGWNILWGIIPFIGGIILFVFSISDSEPVGNEYGPCPKVEAVLV